MAGYCDPPTRGPGRPAGSPNKVTKFRTVREALEKLNFDPLAALIEMLDGELLEKEKIQILSLLVEYSFPKLKPMESDPEVAAQERSLITMSRDDLILIARGKSDAV